MEKLEFNSGGQWSLVKSGDQDDYKSFRVSSQGALPQDNGTKGMLHNSSNTRPPKKQSPEKMTGKVPQPVRSADDDNNPGSPGPVGDRDKADDYKPG